MLPWAQGQAVWQLDWNAKLSARPQEAGDRALARSPFCRQKVGQLVGGRAARVSAQAPLLVYRSGSQLVRQGHELPNVPGQGLD